MNYQETMFYLKVHGAQLGRLHKQKDALASAVVRAYQKHSKDVFNPVIQDELIRVVNEYVIRSLTLTELDDLARRHGVAHPDEPYVVISGNISNNRR